jgi:hypothetical protein
MKLAFWGIPGHRPLARVQGFYPCLVHDGFKVITTWDGTETVPPSRARCMLYSDASLSSEAPAWISTSRGYLLWSHLMQGIDNEALGYANLMPEAYYGSHAI